MYVLCHGARMYQSLHVILIESGDIDNVPHVIDLRGGSMINILCHATSHLATN